MRRLILLLVLPLAACWEGDSFYTASDSRPALPPGAYRAVPADKPSEAKSVQVSMLPNGMTSMVGDGGNNAVGFAPLGGSFFTMWFQHSDGGREALYALFQADRGHYRLIVPFCERTAAIASAAGAQIVKDPKMTTCRFQTRAQLEDGLRHLEGRQQDVVDFIPTGANNPAGSRAGATRQRS